MCERKLETEQNCNILTPTLMAISVSLPFSRAAQPEAWGPSLSGGSCSSIQHILTNSSDPQLVSRGGGHEGSSLYWVLVFSTSILSLTGLVSKLTDFLSSPSYIIVQRSPSSYGRHKLHSFNPSTVKATLCYSSTGCTCYLHRFVSDFDSPAGS